MNSNSYNNNNKIAKYLNELTISKELKDYKNYSSNNNNIYINNDINNKQIKLQKKFTKTALDLLTIALESADLIESNDNSMNEHYLNNKHHNRNYLKAINNNSDSSEYSSKHLHDNEIRNSKNSELSRDSKLQQDNNSRTNNNVIIDNNDDYDELKVYNNYDSLSDDNIDSNNLIQEDLENDDIDEEIQSNKHFININNNIAAANNFSMYNNIKNYIKKIKMVYKSKRNYHNRQKIKKIQNSNIKKIEKYNIQTVKKDYFISTAIHKEKQIDRDRNELLYNQGVLNDIDMDSITNSFDDIESNSDSYIDRNIDTNIHSNIENYVNEDYSDGDDDNIPTIKSSTNLDSKIENLITQIIDNKLDGIIDNKTANSPIVNKIDSEIYEIISNQIENKLDSLISKQLDSKINKIIESKLVSQLNSDTDIKVDKKLANTLNSEIDSKRVTNVYSEINSETNNMIDNELDSKKAHKTVRKVNKELNKVNGILDNKLDIQIDKQLNKANINNYPYISETDVYSRSNDLTDNHSVNYNITDNETIDVNIDRYISDSSINRDKYYNKITNKKSSNKLDSKITNKSEERNFAVRKKSDKLHSLINISTDSIIGSNTDSKIDNKIDYKLNSKLDSKIDDGNLDNQLGNKTENKIDNHLTRLTDNITLLNDINVVNKLDSLLEKLRNKTNNKVYDDSSKFIQSNNQSNDMITNRPIIKEKRHRKTIDTPVIDDLIDNQLVSESISNISTSPSNWVINGSYETTAANKSRYINRSNVYDHRHNILGDINEPHPYSDKNHWIRLTSGQLPNVITNHTIR